MKIGIDIRVLAGEGYGGVSEYVKNILPALFKAAPQHEFHLFFNSWKQGVELPRFKSFSNVKVHYFSYPNKFLTFSFRYLNFPKIDRLIGGVDVFFSPHFLPTPVSRECRKVVKFHDISFERMPRFFNVQRRIWHKYVSPKREAHSSDIVVAASHSTAEDLRLIYGVPRKKIITIYSGINKNIFYNDSANHKRILRKYNLNGNYILTLSTVEPRKNIRALVRAFSLIKTDPRFNNLQLVICGGLGWSYKKIIYEAVNSEYSRDIILTGAVFEEEKPAIYKNARVFIYPSLYEGFGFPPLEAMYSGVPTIVSFTASLPEVVDSSALLVNPFRPGEIADSIKEVLTDQNLATELSEKGARRASTFNWHDTAQAILQVMTSTKR